ncbi:SDR family NAD(P)-dependent oxidoreductase [Roseovarius sp. PS-C2]|jgi:NAD(P)-dependent dehydrogenase (short-subunit alcohol dehydrogenase family)|uniref:SDR family NAD(P)-dependent oxidoreductase n=1 Tax=Roseobacteraceae TaxID=2854170 RepID=UPI001C0E30C7|nr:SDR family NAD(P)-dependent oxidoreductase [Roseovarius sp. PS-C2]MBU3261875.1 SDR family oxidoreductase [Roseovarius sp. PS-C2]|tara:strand:+ start:3137 stop:4057 length:921 start_codon:yes stop_codon:yes gene_type:complete
MSEPKPLGGKVVLVTGAGGGIGRAIALEAAKAGASVVVNDIGASLDGKRESSAAAEQTVTEIEKLGGKAVANGDDVSIQEGAQAMVRQATDSFGRLDAVVNNAGILRDCFFHKMTYEDFDAVVKVHLYGTFNTSRAAADVMREQGSGSLIHMTSTSGLIGNLAQANYSAAKLGIAALSKSIALDLRRWNIRSNCIAPFAWSRMTSSIKVDSPEQEARVNRMKEMAPEKIAPIALYLASDEGADTTGQIFAVRNNEIFLMSQPRPTRSVHRGEGWDLDSVRSHAIPALRGSYVPLDVSADTFSWDPI